MDSEFSIVGRIFPDAGLSPAEFAKFRQKVQWAEQDFESFGFKVRDFSPSETAAVLESPIAFTMKSEDFLPEILEDACRNLSIIFGCHVMLCKDQEIYGVANVFNGGSDYEVVDEDCYLFLYNKGGKILAQQTKFWNEKFNEIEKTFYCQL